MFRTLLPIVFHGASRIAVAGMLAGVLAGAPPASAEGLSGRLTVTGSSSVAPLMADIGRRFEELNPEVRIDVQTGGSSRGIADARQGLADIGMVSRDLKESENDLRAHAVARDGLTLIVHADNPVADLTDEQVVAIYTGRIGNWKEVGGPDREITVVSKAEGRSTLEVFLDHLKLKTTDIQADVVIGDNEQGIKTVAGNAAAIGYVSVGAAEFHGSIGTPIRAIGFGDVPPTSENVANGTYSALRTLNLVTAKDPEGLAAALIDFARSADVHDLVKEQFLVPVAR